MITLQEHNQQLVDFIKSRQPISMSSLFTSFPGAANDSTAFAKRLNYLKSEGWLVVDGRSTSGMWSANSEVRPMHSASTARKPAPRPPNAASTNVPVVQASRINIMRGNYCPPAPLAMRPGSEDHLHLPSLRGNRLVAHVRGYVAY